MQDHTTTYTGLEIAVTGISCAFPGATDLQQYWENLLQGKETVSFFTKDELRESGVEEDLLAHPAYVGAKGIIDGIEFFDYNFFGFTPKEAKILDPQVRMFLQHSWRALEDANIVPDGYRGLIGLYAAHTSNLLWSAKNLLGDQGDGAEEFVAGSYNPDFFSTLISYKLNLRGPSVTINTACSSSLSAIHMACRSLLTSECDVALAGGVTITLPQKKGYLYQDGMVMSKDGHCKPFDHRADGIVNGDGVGVVVLKRLSDAIEAGDAIYGIIKGSAINNDGERKVGYTAPSIEGQVEVIKATHAVAEINPETISYIEAHGTGTSFGDPVEVEALKTAFNSSRTGFCGIGSVKSNMGHLDSASGVAGFIKALMVAKNRTIPPSVNFEKPNPKIHFEKTPFFVVNQRHSLNHAVYPVRAAVSSFGIGGTNAHILVEEYTSKGSQASEGEQIITISGKSKEALESNAKQLAHFLNENKSVGLSNVAYTLATCRKHFNYRKSLVSNDLEEVARELLNPGSSKVKTYQTDEPLKNIVFMFSGQGSQYINMGKDLYEKDEVFKNTVDECLLIARSILGYDFHNILFPVTDTEEDHERIKEIDKSPVAIFILEYSLARLLMSWGIQPTAMIGHSIGEYVSACIAGVFSLGDALKLVASRGVCMKALPKGVMMSVPLTLEELRKHLNEHISVAADHGESCLVSGDKDAIDAFEKQMKEKHCLCQRLTITHAGHSKMMVNMLGDFKQVLERVAFNAPAIPYISTVTGDWIREEDAQSPEYWCRQVCDTVYFAGGVRKLMGYDNIALLEIGPGNVLCTIAIQYRIKGGKQLITNLLKHPQQQISDYKYLLTKLSSYWLYGGQIQWQKIYEGQNASKVHLPAYNFDPVDCGAHVPKVSELIGSKGGGKLEEKRKPMEEWFYLPYWKPSVVKESPVQRNAEGNCLVLLPALADHNKMHELLKTRFKNVMVAKENSAFQNNGNSIYETDFYSEQSVRQLFDALNQEEKLPTHVLNFLNLYSVGPQNNVENDRDLKINRAYYSLFYLAKELASRLDLKVKLLTAASHLADIGGEAIDPYKSLATGISKVIALEYPTTWTKCVHFTIKDNVLEEWQVEKILEELEEPVSAGMVAYHRKTRYVQEFEQSIVKDQQLVKPVFRDGGVYLITGGSGGIGLEITQYLLTHYNIKIVLTGKTPLPPKEAWDTYLTTSGNDERVKNKIRKLKEIEKSDSCVYYQDADVSDHASMLNVREYVHSKLGRLDGILHCAGYSEGRLLQVKTREETEKVFNTKVYGTLVLDKVFKNAPLDFVVLFSSLNSIIPGMGLADYCSANAFLDAFAAFKQYEDKTPYYTLNWDAWQEVGGAFEAAKTLAREIHGSTVVKKDIQLPFFTQYLNDGNLHIFSGTLNESMWALNEHRINEIATMPGTGYVEMVLSSLHYLTKKDSFEINNMAFTQPLMVGAGEEKELQCIITKSGNGFEFKVISRVRAGQDQWEEHSGGTAQEMTSLTDHTNLEEIALNIAGEKVYNNQVNESQGTSPVKFGKRWMNSLQWVKADLNQKLVHLKLSEEYKSDIDTFRAHPAILDTALSTIHTDGFFLPFLYKKLKVYGRISDQVVSYIRYSGQDNSNGKIKRYDATIVDANGVKLAEFEEYTLVATDPSGAVTDTSVKPDIQHTYVAVAGAYAEKVYNYELATLNSVREHLQNGIKPEEGVKVFDRLLKMRLPQVIVSTSNFQERLKESISSGLSREIQTQVSSEKTTISSPVVLPQNELEELITNLWKDYLGLDTISVHDNFFDIGAKSVAIIQVTNKLKAKLGRDIPVTSMYIYPTIRELAVGLSSSQNSSPEKDKETENVKINGRKDKLKMRKMNLKES